MPRSSRNKSHKQHKYSSKDAREHSESEEDGNLKDRKGREEAAVRISRDSGSGEKRKLVSQSQDGKDLFGPGNGDMSEEYVASKRRKDKADAAVSDRWNGGEGERRGGLVGDKETKGEGSRPDSDKGPKSKVSVDSKSKSSRRHDSLSEKKDENLVLAVESEEAGVGSSKVESKRKSEKDSSRKEDQQYKDVKDKEPLADRDRKIEHVRSEKSVDSGRGVAAVASSEMSRKQGSRSGAFEEERLVKQGAENTEWKIQDELRNPELEKELEKRIRRRRDSSGDKDKYQDDVRDSNDRRLSSRDDRAKDGKCEDEKPKDGKHRDNYREDLNRDNRHRDDKHKYERSSRDRTSDRSDTKHSRDESKTAETRNRNSKPPDSGHDSSPHIDGRGTRYKDNKGKRRSSDDNVDHNDIRSRKDSRSDAGKKPLSTSKVETDAGRGRSQSRHADVDSTLSISRRKSSPCSRAHIIKDQFRQPKQAESKYRDFVSEERVQANVTRNEVTDVSGISEKGSKSRTMEKTIQKRDDHLGELSAERSPRSDAQASPMRLMEKSPSSTSIDRRYLNRTSVRRSLDVEETGQRNSSSKDARDYSANEERVSRDFLLDKPPVDEFSQADGDTVSVSSSINRTSHFSSNPASLLPPPPPLRAVVDSTSVMGSLEEDSRGNKSSNRHRRSGDPNLGRGQGNAWKGVPNWHSPVTNGFIPFQHGPPPGTFHAVMQQFPAPPLFGVRHSMELNHTGVPYHISDTDRFSSHGQPFGWRNPVDDSCPSHLHGWDGSNSVFGDESHMYGRQDWDQNRHMMSGRGWETSTDMWKGQNGGANMDLPAALQKEEYPMRAPADEVWTEQSSQRYRSELNRPGLRAESIEIKRSSGIPPANYTSEAPAKTIHEKTPELPKMSSDDSTHFCHAYLSKLDISADLTHPELYNQCMTMLDIERDTTDDDVTDHVHLEESAEAVEISNTTLTASLFTTMGDSIFQRAMALYKKQSADVRAILPVSPYAGSEPEKVLTSDGEKLELIPTTNQDKEEEPHSISNQEKTEEPVPISDQEKAEDPISTSDQETMEEPIPSPGEEKPEELVVTPFLEKAEGSPGDPVLTSDQKPEEPLPTPNQEKVELVTSSQEKSEDAVDDRYSSLENALQAATDSPSNNESINGAGDSMGNHSSNSAENQKAFGDIMCVPLLISDGSSEACGALKPESIESGLVNLSRIHHSPESTH